MLPAGSDGDVSLHHGGGAQVRQGSEASIAAAGRQAGFEIKMLIAVLPKYGANAKYALPRIKAMKGGKFQKQWDEMIDKIESATETRKMISFEEAKQAGLKSDKPNP
jgi:hypothetical protein